MTNPGSITVDRLSKVFNLQKRRKGRTGVSTRELAAMGQLFRSVFGRGVKEGRRFHAVKNISLKVESGEIMGIIGRNGAGKSTLLKMLARVIDPTEGSVRMEGRIASLLELGAGFNGDMSVEENIDLQVSLTGGKSDPELVSQILELADLSDYRNIDLDDCPGSAATRLSFATLITLASEIVIADELLAVGNLQFKKLVLDRIKKVREDGGCVLFVSHDLSAIAELCDRVMWIDRGEAKMVGSAEDVIRAYEAELHAKTSALDSADANDVGRIVDLRLVRRGNQQVGAIELHRRAFLECVFQHVRPGTAMKLRIELNRGRRQVIYSSTRLIEADNGPAQAMSAQLRIPAHFLNEGNYQGKAVLRWDTDDGERKEVSMTTDFLAANSAEDRSVWGDWDGDRRGLVAPRLKWNISFPKRRPGGRRLRADAAAVPDVPATPVEVDGDEATDE